MLTTFVMASKFTFENCPHHDWILVVMVPAKVGASKEEGGLNSVLLETMSKLLLVKILFYFEILLNVLQAKKNSQFAFYYNAWIRCTKQKLPKFASLPLYVQPLKITRNMFDIPSWERSLTSSASSVSVGDRLNPGQSSMVMKMVLGVGRRICSICSVVSSQVERYGQSQSLMSWVNRKIDCARETMSTRDIRAKLKGVFTATRNYDNCCRMLFLYYSKTIA